MTIDFLPSNTKERDITPLMAKIFRDCKCVEGSIAYWTLGIDAIDGQLLQALCKPGSSICIDMQSPTKLQKLVAFEKEIREQKNTSALFICLRKHPNDTRDETVSLLHTKILLFDMGNDQWEMWIGSHNFTRNALKGYNLEGSVRIQGKRNEPEFAPLLDQVQSYLKFIKKLCEAFNPNKITYYEALRGEIDRTSLKKRFEAEIAARIAIENTIISRVLTFRSKDAHLLEKQTIILLGNIYEELGILRQRNRGGTPVYLRIKDSKTAKIYTYEGRIRSSDHIDNIPSYNVSFNDRRWAIRKVLKKDDPAYPPILKPIKNVGSKIISENKYYVNVEVRELLDNEYIGYYTYPETDPSKLWKPDPKAGLSNHLYHPFTNDSTPSQEEQSTVLVPVSYAEELASIRPIDWIQDYMEELLEQRIIVLGSYK